jgi:hypothetical protein
MRCSFFEVPTLFSKFNEKYLPYSNGIKFISISFKNEKSHLMIMI